jgi:hypothetical protein
MMIRQYAVCRGSSIKLHIGKMEEAWSYFQW